MRKFRKGKEEDHFHGNNDMNKEYHLADRTNKIKSNGYLQPGSGETRKPEKIYKKPVGRSCIGKKFRYFFQPVINRECRTVHHSQAG